MSRKEAKTRFSARTLEQLEDLHCWLGETNAAIVIEAAISRAWHIEATRQHEYAGVPWVVRPGLHQFESQDAAVHWLKQMGAQPVSLGTWATEDEDGNTTVWELEPLRSAA